MTDAKVNYHLLPYEFSFMSPVTMKDNPPDVKATYVPTACAIMLAGGTDVSFDTFPWERVIAPPVGPRDRKLNFWTKHHDPKEGVQGEVTSAAIEIPLLWEAWEGIPRTEAGDEEVPGAQHPRWARVREAYERPGLFGGETLWDDAFTAKDRHKAADSLKGSEDMAAELQAIEDAVKAFVFATSEMEDIEVDNTVDADILDLA